MFKEIQDRLKSVAVNAALAMLPKKDRLCQLFLSTMASNIQPVVLLPASHSVAKKIHNRMKHPTKHGLTYSGIINGVKVTMIRTHVGTAATAIIMETLALLKPRAIIRVDYAGSLAESLKVGDVFVAEGAFPGDGTCAHYLKANMERFGFLRVEATGATPKVNDGSGIHQFEDPIHQWLVQEGLTGHLPASSKLLGLVKQVSVRMTFPVKNGLTWTTDGLFLETPAKVARWREAGAIGVDMETSIIYLLGILHDLPVVAIHGISDDVTTGVPFYELKKLDPGIEKGMDSAIDLAVKLLPLV